MDRLLDSTLSGMFSATSIPIPPSSLLELAHISLERGGAMAAVASSLLGKPMWYSLSHHIIIDPLSLLLNSALLSNHRIMVLGVVIAVGHPGEGRCRCVHITRGSCTGMGLGGRREGPQSSVE